MHEVLFIIIGIVISVILIFIVRKVQDDIFDAFYKTMNITSFILALFCGLTIFFIAPKFNPINKMSIEEVELKIKTLSSKDRGYNSLQKRYDKLKKIELNQKEKIEKKQLNQKQRIEKKEQRKIFFNENKVKILKIIFGVISALIIIPDVILFKKRFWLFKFKNYDLYCYYGIFVFPNGEEKRYKQVVFSSFRFAFFIFSIVYFAINSFYLIVSNFLDRCDFNIIYGLCNGFLIYPFFGNLFSENREAIFKDLESNYWISLGIAFVIFSGFIAWLIISAQNKIKKYKREIINYNDDEKALLDKSISERKEEILLWSKSYDDEENARGEESLRNEYNLIREGNTPEDLLKKNNPKNKTKEDRGLFGTISDIIGNGKREVSEAEQQYDNILLTYNVYKARYDLRNFSLDRARKNYEYSVEQANLFAGRIKQITDKINPKERESLFKEANTKENTSNLELITSTSFNIANLKNNIEITNKNFSTEIDRTFDKAENLTDFAVRGIGLALTALENRTKNAERRTEIVQQYNSATKKIIDEIKIVEENRTKVEALTSRTVEISRAIDTALDTYKNTYEMVYNQLFPADDISKTRENRKLRSEGFFTTEENILIRKQFAQILKFLMQVVDTEF